MFLPLSRIPLATLVAVALRWGSPGAVAVPAHALSAGESSTAEMGFHEAIPSFSWKLPVGVKKQSAYRVQASSGEKGWDSGWVTSEQSVCVPYGGEAFTSRQRVTWRVNFRDEQRKEGGWSQPASFELGLLSAREWKARWIRPAGVPGTPGEPAGYLRRTFTLPDKKITRARLYVTARGLFELSLNGRRVGQDFFANGFTSYHHRLDTLSYDVTSELQPGGNTLEGLLGTGWYAGRYPFNAKKPGPYGNNQALLVQMEITFGDGTQETILSDEQWEGTWQGPILSSSLYDGEEYDARRPPAGWAPVAAEAISGTVALTPKPCPPVRLRETLEVKKISEPQPGRYVFDLGQNIVGWARIRIPVEKDAKITVRFAEMLRADGSLYTENYRSAKSTDTYVAAATGTIEWQPHFTFHGFRYVELSGLPAGSAPQKGWVSGLVLSSDLPTIGRFTSSHEKLNQLQSNLVWGWRGNSLEIPTDCPQRDERAGWTGDAQVFCATSLFNTDAQAFWRSWLGSMRDDQDADGVIPDIIPTAGARFRERSYGWMDAATIIPWEVYVRTGNPKVLEENYAMMAKLLRWDEQQLENGLFPRIRGYGDWLQPFPQARATREDKMGDRRGDTPRPFLAAAYFVHSAQIMADSAQVLGRGEDARRYAALAANTRAALTKEYFDAEGRLRPEPETQTAYALAIAFHLLPAELETKAGAHLARLVGAAEDHLRTGFLGTSLLAPALEATGHGDTAARLLFQESYPSWFYPLNQGATTMWERWNSYTRDKGFGDVSMNSFNHYAYGAIGQWLYEHVAGLAPDPRVPGYKHLLVRPFFVPQLRSARAELETPYGQAISAWTKQAGAVTMEITVPPNTTASVHYPDRPEAVELEAGTYRSSFPLSAPKP